MIGIIGAMPEEVEALKTQMEQTEMSTCAGLTFVRGTLRGQDAVVVCSGVGKVNAAMVSQILISKYHADELINTGVAGGLLLHMHKGDIVLSKEARYHDYDVSPLGIAPGEMMGMPTSVFPADSRLLALAQDSCRRLIPEGRWHVGRIVSGDQFITGNENQRRLREEFGGACAEMEGAAIAQVAYLNQVPFLIVRAISDGADDDSPMDFATFKAKAIEIGTELVLDILENTR